MTTAGLKTKTAVLRGLKTAWLDNENEGRPIALFLHGYPDTPLTWAEQARAFGERYHVILPFVRGVGGSAAPSEARRYGVFSILLDHLEILRRVDPEGRTPIHVVGHDWGGVHAWMLAGHPDKRLKTLTILNSVHPKQWARRALWPRQILKSWYVGAFQVPWLAEGAVWLFHKEIVKSIQAQGWRPPHGELKINDFEGAAINAMNQYRQLARDLPRFFREKPAPTRAPVLVIASEGDAYLEEPSAPEFADLAERFTLRVVKGKHWVHHEQPERINRLLSEFWEANP